MGRHEKVSRIYFKLCSNLTKSRFMNEPLDNPSSHYKLGCTPNIADNGTHPFDQNKHTHNSPVTVLSLARGVALLGDWTACLLSIHVLIREDNPQHFLATNSLPHHNGCWFVLLPGCWYYHLQLMVSRRTVGATRRQQTPTITILDATEMVRRDVGIAAGTKTQKSDKVSCN